MRESDTFRAVSIQVKGGPYDGAVFVTPLNSEGQYGSVLPANPIWGIPVRIEDGKRLLYWEDIEMQQRVYDEMRPLIENLARLLKRPTPWDEERGGWTHGTV